MRKLFVTLFALLSVVIANAQEQPTAPYWFVSARGGISMPHEGDYSKIFYKAPTASFSVGKMLTNQIGFRANVNRDFPSATQELTLIPQPVACKDKFTVDVDGLFNLSTILGNKDYYKFNVFMIAGLGYDHLGGGLGLSYDVTRNLSVVGETTLNSHQVWKAEIGLSFRIGGKKVKQAPVIVEEPVYVPVVEEPVVQEPVKVEPAPAPAPAPETKTVVVKVAPLKETIFYSLAKSAADDDAVINRIVDWCNNYSDKNIVVSGYADKGTGSSEINAKLAEERATKVADKIVAKGIDASRITVKSYGDTVQPYGENDLNRVTIIESVE